MLGAILFTVILTWGMKKSQEMESPTNKITDFCDTDLLCSNTFIALNQNLDNINLTLYINTIFFGEHDLLS